MKWYCGTYPNAIEDVAVREDSDVKVGLDDRVELALLLIPKESVRHPNLKQVCI